MIQSTAHDAVHLIEKRGYYAGLPMADAAIARAWIERHSEKLTGDAYFGTYDWCCEWLGEHGIAKLAHDILHLGAYDLKTETENGATYSRCPKCKDWHINTAGELRLALCERIELAWLEAKLANGIAPQLKLFEPNPMPVMAFDVNPPMMAMVV
jgi:hypothetical protein